MIYFTYLAMAFAIWLTIKEMYKLQILSKQWKYIDWNPKHNTQHQVIFAMTVLILILMFINCHNYQWIPIMLFSLLQIFFIIPHFRAERKDFFKN